MDCHDFSNMMEWLNHFIQQFPQVPQMLLVRSNGLVYLQEPPGLLVPCCVVPPASTGMVEDSQEEQGL